MKINRRLSSGESKERPKTSDIEANLGHDGGKRGDGRGNLEVFLAHLANDDDVANTAILSFG